MSVNKQTFTSMTHNYTRCAKKDCSWIPYGLVLTLKERKDACKAHFRCHMPEKKTHLCSGEFISEDLDSQWTQCKNVITKYNDICMECLSKKKNNRFQIRSEEQNGNFRTHISQKHLELRNDMKQREADIWQIR